MKEVIKAIQDAKTYKLMRKHASKLTTDGPTIQDIIQQAVLKALIYKNNYREHTNIEGRLQTITRNEAMNEHRRKKRKPTTHMDPTSYSIDTQKIYNNGPNNIDITTIRQCIQKLKPDEQYYIKFVEEGYKYEEIAEKMNIPMGTVQSGIFKARKNLADMLIKMDPTLKPLTRKNTYKSSPKPSQPGQDFPQ